MAMSASTTSEAENTSGEHILITIASEQGDNSASPVDIVKSITFIRGLIDSIKVDCDELIEDTSMTVSQNLVKLNNTNVKYVKAKLSLMYLRNNMNNEHKKEIQLITRDFVAAAKIY